MDCGGQSVGGDGDEEFSRDVWVLGPPEGESDHRRADQAGNRFQATFGDDELWVAAEHGDVSGSSLRLHVEVERLDQGVACGVAEQESGSVGTLLDASTIPSSGYDCPSLTTVGFDRGCGG